jgi:hypothetical protein
MVLISQLPAIHIVLQGKLEHSSYLHIIELMLVVAPYRVVEVIAGTHNSNRLVGIILVQLA